MVSSPKLLCRAYQCICFGLHNNFFHFEAYFACTHVLANTELECNPGQIPQLIIVADRCSVSYSAIHYLMDACQLVIGFMPDPFHDEWNGIQQACKRCDWWPWGKVCQMSLVYNCWRMPFGSRSFAKTRQEVFQKLIEQGPTGETFQRHKHAIAAEAGITLEEEEDDWRVLEYLSGLHRGEGQVLS